MPFRDRPPTGLGRMTTRRVIAQNVTEAQFQAMVIETAQWFDWRVFHPLTMKNAAGRYLTAFTGASGFPDLVLVHPKHGVIFAELKTQTGRLTNGQQLWRADLETAGAEYHLWRPSDFHTIEKRLRGQK